MDAFLDVLSTPALVAAADENEAAVRARGWLRRCDRKLSIAALSRVAY